MKITEKNLNLKEFNSRSKDKWKNEPMKFFKCKKCKFIVLGLPDCHIAITNPDNLSQIVQYNLPRKALCPNCKAIWYNPPKCSSWQVEDVNVEELKSSNWSWIL